MTFLNNEPASLNRRLLAQVINIIYFLLPAFLIFIFAGQQFLINRSDSTVEEFQLETWQAFLVAMMFTNLFYVSWIMGYSGSPGMVLLNMRIADEYGKRVHLGRAIVREFILKPINILFLGAGFWYAYRNEDKVTLYDKILNTKVLTALKPPDVKRSVWKRLIIYYIIIGILMGLVYWISESNRIDFNELDPPPALETDGMQMKVLSFDKYDGETGFSQFEVALGDVITALDLEVVFNDKLDRFDPDDVELYTKDGNAIYMNFWSRYLDQNGEEIEDVNDMHNIPIHLQLYYEIPNKDSEYHIVYWGSYWGKVGYDSSDSIDKKIGDSTNEGIIHEYDKLNYCEESDDCIESPIVYCCYHLINKEADLSSVNEMINEVDPSKMMMCDCYSIDDKEIICSDGKCIIDFS